MTKTLGPLKPIPTTLIDPVVSRHQDGETWTRRMKDEDSSERLVCINYTGVADRIIMEAQVQRLAEKTWEKFQNVDAANRLLIAIAGIPGSGKTTLASTVARDINARFHAANHKLHPHIPIPDPSHPDPSQPDIAIALPLDGYHLTRAQLAALPNAEEAVFRRGAAFTFDGEAFLAFVRRLREPLEASARTLHAPSFDHAIKDPVADDIPIHPTSRIILIEGNYVALNQPPWSEAAALMDELWFIDVPISVATARLVKRHVAAGISPDPEHALKRVRESDMRNGREIIEGRIDCQEVIESVEDESWRTIKIDDADKGELAQAQQRSSGMPRISRLDSIAALAADGVGM